jgi:hypothetical protein
MPLISSSFLIIRLKIVQHEAKEKLEKDLLQTWVLSKNEFRKKTAGMSSKVFTIMMKLP